MYIYTCIYIYIYNRCVLWRWRGPPDSVTFCNRTHSAHSCTCIWVYSVNESCKWVTYEYVYIYTYVHMNNIYVLFTPLYILIHTIYLFTCAGMRNVTESQRRPSPAPEDSEIVVPGVLFATPLDAIHKCNTLHYNTLQHTATYCTTGMLQRLWCWDPLLPRLSMQSTNVSPTS